LRGKQGSEREGRGVRGVQHGVFAIPQDLEKEAYT